MKIFMIGSTGLLGASSADELIKRGHEVTSIALPNIPKGAYLNPDLKITYGNYLELNDDEIRANLNGCEGIVFAAGVDERVEFKKPVYESYEKYNIKSLERILKIAKEEKIKKVVVLGSYFAYFAKKYPKMKLCDRHPYIRSRIEQENLALSYGGDGMEVVVLELPYIFGIQKGRKPVWTVILEQILKMKDNTYYPRGGTTMVTVKQVAQCVAGAIENSTGTMSCPVGWYNMTWKELLGIVHEAIGMKNRKVITIPKFLYKLYSFKIIKEYQKKEVEPGLNPYYLGDIMYKNLFIEPDIIKNVLKVEEDNIKQAIIDSFKLSMEALKNDKKFVGMKAE
ncbi:MAG: NAD(P)-dependent oxidoreductase [Clostridia bacterium]|nr:NAD(P)-dependent oxidoreductase [Clostridia bacterium]